MVKGQVIRKDEGSTQETEMQKSCKLCGEAFAFPDGKTEESICTECKYAQIDKMKNITSSLGYSQTDNRHLGVSVWNNGETDINLHNAIDVKIGKWETITNKKTGSKFQVKTISVENENGTNTEFNIFRNVREKK